jgi:hypothetical protein
MLSADEDVEQLEFSHTTSKRIRCYDYFGNYVTAPTKAERVTAI